jgi:hypothetical protein
VIQLVCHSAWSPNADRRGNSLNCLRKEGSNSEADSHLALGMRESFAPGLSTTYARRHG